MKIIHTYAPISGYEIGKRNLYMMTLSLLLAKKYFDKVVLYTDKKNAEIVKEIGLPYDEIDDSLLEGLRTKTFSIPKVLVYSVQNEPFVHIDLDTFIFHKIKFNDTNLSYSTFNEGACSFNRLDDSLIGFYNTYLGSTFELLDKLDPDFSKNVYFGEIPNMSVFGGHQYELIAKSSKYCLDLYEKHRDFFDSKFYNACIIEQLFIPSAMRMYEENTKFSFLYATDTIMGFDFPDEENESYPFHFLMNNERIVTIKNEVDLYDKIGYDFKGFLHLCGNKKFNKIMYILRGKIILDFNNGYSYIQKIDKMYDENMNIDYDLSYYNEMKKISNKRKPLI